MAASLAFLVMSPSLFLLLNQSTYNAEAECKSLHPRVSYPEIVYGDLDYSQHIAAILSAMPTKI